MVSKMGPWTAKRTVSIKRPGLNFLKKSLLNDQYYLKNQRSKQQIDQVLYLIEL